MFKKRSYQKELLDEPNIQKELLYKNLEELEFINKYLGGHRISLKGMKSVMQNYPQTTNMMDIGCGGGDSLKAIASWSDKKKLSLDLTGVDLKQDCIDFATKNCSPFKNIHFTCDDFRAAFSGKNKIHLVHASLFCHHFTENEIIEFIRLCDRNKAIFVINDLERHPIAYYSIKWLTKLFSGSPLVKNDAPLSVLRGFKKREWRLILDQAGIKNYSVKSYWAFRHLVIVYPNGEGF